MKRTVTVEHNVQFMCDGSDVVIAGADELEGEYGGSDEKLATTADSTPRAQAPVSENESVQVKKKEGLSRNDTPMPDVAPRRSSCISQPSRYMCDVLAGAGSATSRHGHPALPAGVSTRNEPKSLPDVVEEVQEPSVAALAAAIADAEGLELRNIEEARRCTDWPWWDAAIRKELEKLKAARTWTIVDKPDGVNVVGSK